ncbi:hypothetical protein [Gilvimarinus chinensis]|uniref:hypothetical protein n=1 Tax=Gilvimarinus chinensis TaxID=396005 RepID=UPI00037C0D13|nr:hypothetical protein [Gilvimarinus chinensis]
MLINAITIPVIRQEMKSLQEWIKDCPTPGMNVPIYLSIDKQWQEQEKRELLKVHNASHARDCPLRFIDCGIEPSQSFYEKDKSIEGFDSNSYPYGKKSGPNIQFFRTLRKISSIQPNISGLLLLETDAHPILQNWAHELNQRIQWLGNNVYIAGSRPVMAETIGPIKSHINGNALYNLGNTNFSNFLDFWEETLIESVKLNPDIAYDVALEWSYHTFKSSNSNEFLKKIWDKESAHRYKRGCIDISSYILNVSGCSDTEQAKIQIENHLTQNRRTVILHGKYQNHDGEDIILQLKRTILEDQLSP